MLVVLVARRGLAATREHPAAFGVLAAVTVYGIAVLANPTAAGPTCLAAFLTGVLVAEPAPEPEERWVCRGCGLAPV